MKCCILSTFPVITNFTNETNHWFYLDLLIRCDEVIITRPSGTDLKVDEFVAKGFFRPIVVNKMDGLGLRVPPSTFTVRDVERYLDPERAVDVIDVEQQTECRMAFREFADYFTDVNRKRLLNLISLEVSQTK